MLVANPTNLSVRDRVVGAMFERCWAATRELIPATIRMHIITRRVGEPAALGLVTDGLLWEIEGR